MYNLVLIHTKRPSLPWVKNKYRDIYRWRGGSVQLTSCTNYFRTAAFDNAKIIHFFYQTSYVNQEVICIELSVSVPCWSVLYLLVIVLNANAIH